MKFSEIAAASESEILSSQHEKDIDLARSKCEMAKKYLLDKQKELDDYKGETHKVIRGQSKLSIDLLNTLVAEAESQIQATQVDVDMAEVELQKLLETSEELKREYDQLLSWADLYDKSSFEAKKVVELPKAPADGKPAGPTASVKPSEEKKPTEPPKAPTDGKATDPAAPDRPEEVKKPAEPTKAPADGKPAGPTAPVKPGEEKKSAEQPKAPANDKPAGPATPIKPDEVKKPAAEGNPPTPPSAEDEIPKNFTLPITKTGQSEIITTLKVSEIFKFEGHPFNVRDDQDMWDLVESVKQFGVLEPVVVIPRKEGGYEMVSGHRRQRACQLAGIETMPVIVRNLDRDEATISMVDANLKRENITPMEKARAYSMKLEAMKRKAGRLSKADILNGAKPMRADEQLAQQTGESRANIQKITRLTKLEPELQKMVDKKVLPVHTAADISYLKKDEQKKLADAIEKEGGTVPSGTQAAALKKESQAGSLTPEKIEKTVAPTKREVEPPLKVTFSDEELRPYFPGERVTVPEVKRTVFEALDLRKRALARQASKEGKEVKDKKPGLAR